MKEFPIHQNLSTSFVDLPALVRHLRGFQFVGMVHLELSNYEARIIFDSFGKLIAEEIDHGSGMLSRGTEAYKRILSRSRETHGQIHVLRTEFRQGEFPSDPVFIENSISRAARAMAKGISDSPVRDVIKSQPRSIETPEALLLGKLLAELLETFDDVLTKSNLNFAAAFKNAAYGVKARHPFINPERQAVIFKNGKVSISVTVLPEQFTEGVIDILNVILARLFGNKSFAKLIAYLQHRIMMHIDRRNNEYVKLGVLHLLDQLKIT